MDKFCGSPLWDLSESWNTTTPDFSICVKKTLLVWTPVVLICCLTPFEFYYIVHSVCKYIPRRGLFYSKVILTLLLLLLCLCDMLLSVGMLTIGETVYAVQFLNPLLRIFSYELVIALLLFTQSYGLSRSGVLFWFWFISILTGVFDARTDTIDLIHSKISGHLFTRFGYFIIFIIQFILTFFKERLPMHIPYPITEKLCPVNFVSYPSTVFVTWVNYLISKGNKVPLKRTDLWDCPYELSCHYITPLFDRYFKPVVLSKRYTDTERYSSLNRFSYDTSIRGTYDHILMNTAGRKRRKKKSVALALLKAFYPSFLFSMWLNLIQVFLLFLNPLILRQLLLNFDSRGEKSHREVQWKGYFFSVSIFLVAMLQTVISIHYFIKIFTVELQAQIALSSAIYRKALLLSNSAKKNRTVGEIVNLIAVDVDLVVDAISCINMMWTIPLQLTLTFLFLYWEIGFSVLACLILLLCFFPIQIFGASVHKRFQEKQMKCKDDRIKLMAEILTGFKALRLYAWETYFEKHVLKIRQYEIKYLRYIAYTLTLLSFFWLCTPFLMALSTFTCYVLIDSSNVLTPSIAFVSLALFNMLQIPLALFPLVVSSLVQAYVSLQRINDYLNSEERNDEDVTHDLNEEDAIVVENSTFSYGEELVLKNLNINISTGALVALVGSIGSGKTSLIAALLGDIPKLNGRVNIKGRIAYVPQQAWMISGTVRNNILFGKPYNKALYEAVITGCDLEQDFRQLPSGDLTEITGKGITLSGGQKQRISIARAAYSEADLYLMDDPLSAMDSQVGKCVFEKIIGPDGLLSTKTRLVVTQSVNLLHYFSRIIMLSNGEVVEDGTFNDLLSSRGPFSFFVLQYLAAPNELPDTAKESHGTKTANIVVSASSEPLSVSYSATAIEEPTTSTDQTTEPVKEHTKENLTLKSGSNVRLVVLDDSATRQQNRQRTGSTQKSKPRFSELPPKLSIRKSELGDVTSYRKSSILDRRFESSIIERVAEEEFTETGRVKCGIYMEYLKSMGISLVAAFLILFTIYQIFQCSSTIWLSEYTGQSFNTKVFLIGYALIGVGQFISIGFATLLVNLGALAASKKLHNAMLFNVLRLPLQFFTITPYGRILNRFSKDIDALDVMIPISLEAVMCVAFMVLGILFVITFFLPPFIIFIIPLLVAYCCLQRYYVTISRQLRRLESVNRSPIYSHFEETLSGAATIRAYGAQNRFIEEYHIVLEKNIICVYPSMMSDRWLQVRLETMGNLVVFITTFCATLQHRSMSTGEIGLIITYAMMITINLIILVRNATTVETNIIGAERIKEYSILPQEAPWTIYPNVVSDRWPIKGEVRFENLSFRYREGLQLALKNISFTIEGGEKVGIVGRTGAGKSSLTMALFRMGEAATGSIFIDNIDISTIGLHTLRSRITIIPQDPILFSGTIRRNLDPAHQFKDKNLQEALQTAHLPSLATHLDLMVSEGGENFSVGQCQLFCLARALLRKSKVLVLDEATSNIDYQTEELLQETIKKEFADCTILTIAHRLNTIMDSDRILVLSNGRVAEFDSPENLLQNANSIFYALAKDAEIV